MASPEKVDSVNAPASTAHVEHPNVPLPCGQAQDLQELVRVAAGSVGREDLRVSCGLSLDPGTGMTETIATTDDLPIRFDWLQHELRQGPRSEPTRDDEVVLSTDLARDGRWPEFGPLCASVLGVHSVLSVRVATVDDSHAALNFCADVPRAFDDEDATRADLLAREAATLAKLGADYLKAADAGADPHVDSRLARALGMVMARYRMTSADAFFMLDKASRDMGVDLIDLATEVVIAGRLPARRISEVRAERAGKDRP